MLVSAILLTHPRAFEAQFLADALWCYSRQTYPERELILVDDGEPRIEQTLTGLRITVPPGTSVGAKRNVACEHARGTLIAHWDSDDLCGPERLANQVQQIRSSGCEVTGYHTMHFLDDEQRVAHFYKSYPGYTLGTSLMYHRAAWLRRRFEDMMIGEDNVFLQSFKYEKKYTADADRMLIARNHCDNTSPRLLRPESGWLEEDYGIIASWADAIAPRRFNPNALRPGNPDAVGDRPGPGPGQDRATRGRRPGAAVVTNSRT